MLLYVNINNSRIHGAKDEQKQQKPSPNSHWNARPLFNVSGKTLCNLLCTILSQFNLDSFNLIWNVSVNHWQCTKWQLKKKKKPYTKSDVELSLANTRLCFVSFLIVLEWRFWFRCDKIPWTELFQKHEQGGQQLPFWMCWLNDLYWIHSVVDDYPVMPFQQEYDTPD